MAPTRSVLLIPATHSNDQEAADKQLQHCFLSEHPFTGSPTIHCCMGEPHLYTSAYANVQAQEITCLCMHTRYWYTDTTKLITSTPTSPPCPSNDTVLLHVNTFHNNNVLLCSYTVQTDN